MIQDATGKFSSRCVLPDRSSLALVIKNWLHSSGHGELVRPRNLRMPIGRKPHIGEYANKTNVPPIARTRCRGQIKPLQAPQRRLLDVRAVLLSVVSQHLIAGLGQFWTMLLKASQNREVALIDQRAAKALDIARASLLLVWRAAALLLGDGPGGHRQQDKCQEKFTHRVPSCDRRIQPE
jgi:hypothetical protein